LTKHYRSEAREVVTAKAVNLNGNATAKDVIWIKTYTQLCYELPRICRKRYYDNGMQAFA